MKNLSFETLKGLVTREEGLSEAEVAHQRLLHGSNEIVEITGNPWAELVRDTLKDPMIWFLLGVGLVFIIVGETSEAVVLLVAIFPLALMDALLHWRTQASTRSLKGQLASTAQVVRGNSEVQIDAREIVPGDLIIVTSGLFIPADGVFQDVDALQVDESILTGEAFPLHKQQSRLDLFTLADAGETAIPAHCLGYAGTRVLTGRGRMRVLFTGQRTSYGEIVRSAASVGHERTPLQNSIAKLVQALTIAATSFCLLLAGVRIYQGYGWLDALLSSATLAVAAIPEEFPVVFTFFLGVGVYRLARRRALVRRAVSVENIGRVTQICTDKTGTITRGILQLTHIDPANALTESETLGAALAASSEGTSDPVDLAIQASAHQRKITSAHRLRVFPFTEDRKQQTVFALKNGNQLIAFMKGAPETVLAESTLTPELRLFWKVRTAQWAGEGHKVLACARKTVGRAEDAHSFEEPKTGFEFCGLLAFEDPPRPEVVGAMGYCERNGIRVLMITGDHRETAAAIARDVGLGGGSPVVVSAEDEPEKFQDEWLRRNPHFLRGLHVVARCTPVQKLKIVNAFKLYGELVAVTGDGVNDVPALKAADVGIAMGERGTRSAKEVSSIVLADDNFRTIVDAIREGRQLFTNLKKSFKYLLLMHIPFVLTAAAIPLMGVPLLYLPIHIVWLELIIHPSALFAFQQRASDGDGAVKSSNDFFSWTDSLHIAVVGLTMTLALSFTFISKLHENSDLDRARTHALVILALWSVGLVAYLSRLKTRASILVVLGTLISTIIVVQTPRFSSWLHFAPLRMQDWGMATGGVVVALILLALGTLGRKSTTRSSHVES